MTELTILAICKAGCHGGSCSVPGTCDCFENWTGELCDACSAEWAGQDCSLGRPYHLSFGVDFMIPFSARCASGCINGDCLRPGDCICQEGFHGVLCDEGVEAGDGALGANMCKYADASSSCRLGWMRCDAHFSCPILLQALPTRPTALPATSSSALRNVIALDTLTLFASASAATAGRAQTVSRVCCSSRVHCQTHSHVAVCDPLCVNGLCSDTHECECFGTATGPTCATCIDGWTGETCTTRLFRLGLSSFLSFLL